jgi:hypothetical protein
MEMATFSSLTYTHIYSTADGSLGHKVYPKPTQTNLLLNSCSHRHPSNRHALLLTLVHRAGALCDHDTLHDEVSEGHSQAEWL